MYSQVPIPIHGNTIECAFKINFVLVFFKVVKLKNYFRVDNALTIGIGTCIAYTLPIPIPSKIAGIGPIPIQIPGIGTALV